MRDHIQIIRPGKLKLRLAAIAAAAFCLVMLWFSVGWQIGTMFAEVGSRNNPDAAAIAENAIRFAPQNPRGYWLAGSVLKSAFDEPSFDAAVERYEAAARVSPHNFFTWTELGRVREQVGSYDQAEAAFLKAAAVAPEYTIPRWQLGNFYLRRGRIDDAVRELKLAARHGSPYQVPVFSIAWNVLGNDPHQVEQFLAEGEESKATLAYFYGTVNRPDDAVRIWNQIEPENRQKFDWQMKALARDLTVHQSLRGALEFVRQMGIDTDARPDAITNGDLESSIPPSGSIRFNWTISRLDGKIDVSADSSTSKSGKRSLRFSFRGYPKAQFNMLEQRVAVSPGRRFRLTFWVRTENLRSGSMPLLEVRNVKDGLTIGASTPFASGTTDWTELAIEFGVPPDSDGILVATNREGCAGECPITGIFWLDDFQLSALQ